MHAKRLVLCEYCVHEYAPFPRVEPVTYLYRKLMQHPTMQIGYLRQTPVRAQHFAFVSGDSIQR